MVTITFIRHGPSVSNEMREAGKAGSQDVLDPPLSTKGMAAAKAYGPSLQRRLKRAGVDLTRARFASSELRRARDTAKALFPEKSVIVLGSFAENGAVPENTPEGHPYAAPNLQKTLEHLEALSIGFGHYNFVVVGHGSFLTNTVWPTLTGTEHTKFRNLDAFTVKGTFTKTGFETREFIDLPYKKQRPTQMKKTSRKTFRKTSRNVKKTKTKRSFTRSQRGGYPLAMYNPGGQFVGTTSSGGSLGASDSWIRAPLTRF